MEAFKDGFGSWRFLPINGGILDQPASLMHDVLLWKMLTTRITKQNEASAKISKVATGMDHAK